jgi:hypothetical protein
MVNLIIGRVVWLFNISLSVFITYYWLYQMKLKQLNDTISLSNVFILSDIRSDSIFNCFIKNTSRLIVGNKLQLYYPYICWHISI